MSTEDQNNTRTGITILTTLIGLVVFLAAAGVAVYWVMNPPRAERKPPDRQQALLVQTRTVEKTPHRVDVHAMGRVTPAEQVKLVSRVSGQLVHVSPSLVPGEHLEKGTVVARVDPEDYDIAVQEARENYEQAKLTAQERKLSIEQKNSQIAEAKKNLQLEQAEQEVARREFDLLDQLTLDGDNPLLPSDISEQERTLILKKPQVASARAALASAKAEKKKAKIAYRNAVQAKKKAKTNLEKAKLNLERTTIKVPFDAVVQSKDVGTGTYVSTGTPIGTFVRTDAYWIEVSVPVNKLKYIRNGSANGDASRATVRFKFGWEPGQKRTGQVLRIQPDIEERGRMARVIVRVQDPRSLRDEHADRPRLLLDTMVNVRIEGERIPSAVRVSRSALRESNQVWIMNEQDKLDIRTVRTIPAGPDAVLVPDGLSDGDRLVTSDIPSPVDGMNLRQRETENDPSESKSKPARTNSATKSATSNESAGESQ